LWRVLFSRKHLLEWLPSAEAERQRPATSPVLFWPNYCASALLIAASLHAPAWLFGAVPLSVFWALAPLTAKWLDAKETPSRPITREQKELLEDIARRTFRFFEETVTDATNHLPPDNLQLEPYRGIAPRTSPTNIGMYLLSCVSACELAILDADTMARRIEKTVSAMERMDTWHGHLYNWYDVRTLKALPHQYISSVDGGNLAGCLLLTAQAVRSRLSQVDANLLPLPARLDALAAGMDFSRLYDERVGLFYVGVDVETGVPSGSHYDLLASEARLLSYIALMRREVPMKHWRRLGRAMTKTPNGAALLSWSGTMFEYLLPMLFLKSPHGTLLGDTPLHAAREQARAMGGGPWGVSESGYYAFDPTLSYQYRAFGLPSLALRTARLSRVIAPYASALALGVLPREAAENLQTMASMGWLGDLGFYEAVDYEPERLAKGKEYAIVRSHMAHHQGMVLASICNLLSGGALTRHFHSLPQAEAYALLLEERKPTRAMLRGAVTSRKPEYARKQEELPPRHAGAREFPAEAQILFGGGTTMACDARGSGYISHNGLLLTRRRLDPLYEGGPQYYLRFPDGEVLRMQKDGDVWFDRSRATYCRTHGGLKAELICFVSPLDGAAMHLLRLRAAPGRDVEMEVASFFEVCLSTQAADESHPAFSNLSVETKRLTDTSAVAWRRPQKQAEAYPLLVHAVGADTAAIARLETSRMAFLGRGERLDHPLALAAPYSAADGETGAVLDPCMSLRLPVMVEAGNMACVWFVTAAVQNEEKADALVSQYASRDHVLRALELSQTQVEVTAKYLGLDAAAQLTAQRLASWLLCPFPAQTWPRENRSCLWPFSISGELPVILARVSDEAHMPLARAALKAHAYLRAMGLWSDLALLNEQEGGYHRPVHDALHALVASGSSRDLIGQAAGVHLLDAHAGHGVLQALSAHAAIELRGGEGSLAAQLLARRRALPVLRHGWPQKKIWPGAKAAAPGSLAFDNGYGGFGADGAYTIYREPPAPWCNVLANPDFGAVITERGAGFTWYQNSRMRRLTAFSSDPVRDQRCEALWVRDEENGQFVSPMNAALVTHGFGFTRFESKALGLALTLTVFVDAQMPVKCFLLEMQNPSDAPRQVTVTGAVRWLLGSLWQDANQVRCTASGGTVLAASPAFETKAFWTMPGRQAEASLSGASFFGEGGMEDPLGMRFARLDPGRDEMPCGILRAPVAVSARGAQAVVLLLGVGDMDAAIAAYQHGGA
ncbi:MAG: hypothetical protein FWF69_00805, partial [Firmicutes bacterium]|nr:hypothetical protein [Bacillota bacterium]